MSSSFPADIFGSHNSGRENLKTGPHCEVLNSQDSSTREIKFGKTSLGEGNTYSPTGYPKEHSTGLLEGDGSCTESSFYCQIRLKKAGLKKVKWFVFCCFFFFSCSNSQNHQFTDVCCKFPSRGRDVTFTEILSKGKRALTEELQVSADKLFQPGNVSGFSTWVCFLLLQMRCS